jgi:hypothetical protein
MPREVVAANTERNTRGPTNTVEPKPKVVDQEPAVPEVEIAPPPRARPVKAPTTRPIESISPRPIVKPAGVVPGVEVAPAPRVKMN